MSEKEGGRRRTVRVLLDFVRGEEGARAHPMASEVVQVRDHVLSRSSAGRGREGGKKLWAGVWWLRLIMARRLNIAVRQGARWEGRVAKRGARGVRINITAPSALRP